MRRVRERSIRPVCVGIELRQRGASPVVGVLLYRVGGG